MGFPIGHTDLNS